MTDRVFEFSREESTEFLRIGHTHWRKRQGTIPSRSSQATPLVTPQDSILETLLFTMYAWYLDPTNRTLSDREDRPNDYARNTGSTNNYAAQRLQKITDWRGNILFGSYMTVISVTCTLDQYMSNHCLGEVSIPKNQTNNNTMQDIPLSCTANWELERLQSDQVQILTNHLQGNDQQSEQRVAQRQTNLAKTNRVR